MNKRFPSSKRNTVNSNNQQNNNDDKKKNKSKRFRGLRNSQPISSSSPKTNTDKLDGKKQEKEESIVTDTWIQAAQSMNYYIESPMVPAYNATFAFEDEPFINYLDPFVLFESFGCIGEEIDSRVGMQPVMP